MTVSVLSAAKYLAEKSGWQLSNLELQKLIYLAHMFHLGRTGEPLVSGKFEAWDYGPVHPALYHRAKVFGAEAVENIFHAQPDLPSGKERDILDEAFESLGRAGAGRLVRATHRPGGAWDRHYVPGALGVQIPNAEILAEYRALDAAA